MKNGRAMNRPRHEQAAHASEIDGREKVQQVDIQHQPLVQMFAGVGCDAARGQKPVRAGVGVINLQQKRRQFRLAVADESARRRD
jgi:hypothetical protein